MLGSKSGVFEALKERGEGNTLSDVAQRGNLERTRHEGGKRTLEKSCEGAFDKSNPEGNTGESREGKGMEIKKHNNYEGGNDKRSGNQYRTSKIVCT